jgi:Protein of unknown function (DUF3429)
MAEARFSPDAPLAPKVAWALTIAGLAPFLAAAIIALAFGGSFRGWIAEEVATLYGAVILSFLGGVRWGVALARGPAAALIGSVLPSLAGFGALFMDVMPALLVLIGGFALQMAWDALSSRDLPDWFIRMRLAVTIAVIACLAAVLSAAV